MFFENPIKGPDPSWDPADGQQHNPSGEENRLELTPLPVMEADIYREQCQRLAADLDNLRKRQRREAERLVALERRAILGDLLEVLDTFDRVIAMHGAESNQWLDGLDATRNQLLDVLKRHGAEPFESIGQPFDPNRHEAIATAHVPNFNEGTVVEVILNGYIMSDRTLLRPAKVVVVRHS